jgi:hypothetical protein
MKNNESQASVIYPTRAEVIMMLAIMALLVLQLAWTIRAATYEPTCVPEIIKTEGIK